MLARCVWLRLETFPTHMEAPLASFPSRSQLTKSTIITETYWFILGSFLMAPLWWTARSFAFLTLVSFSFSCFILVVFIIGTWRTRFLDRHHQEMHFRINCQQAWYHLDAAQHVLVCVFGQLLPQHAIGLFGLLHVTLQFGGGSR